MADQFPQNIEIEVDRDAYRAYLRTKWLGSWVGILAFLGCALGLPVTSACLGRPAPFSIATLGFFALGIASGLVASSALATGLYFLLSHRIAGRMAASLRVTVEGPFLRIVQEDYVRTDRKLHFRSIVDYSTVEGYLMRYFGIMELRMTTTGGGALSGPNIIGLKDCPKVRDMLAEIDSIREQ